MEYKTTLSKKQCAFIYEHLPIFINRFERETGNKMTESVKETIKVILLNTMYEKEGIK